MTTAMNKHKKKWCDEKTKIAENRLSEFLFGLVSE